MAGQTPTVSRKYLRLMAASLVGVAFVGLYVLGALGPTEPAEIAEAFAIRSTDGAAIGRKSGFLVSSPSCQIPDVPPRHETIRKYLKSGEQIVCSRNAPLTYTTAEEDGSQTLRVDRALVSRYISSEKRLRCCYSVVTRLSDAKNNASACVAFSWTAVLSPTTDFVYVQCADAHHAAKKVYANVHALVQVKRPPPPTAPPRRLSVLLLGIDSISRLNMIRSMPRTVAHLHAQGWLELRGYNKVGDNTIPNLMAVLTGLGMAQLRNISCALPQSKQGYDHCPFIWKEFARKGYVTSYLEDEMTLSTFNYLSAGFKRQPTDHYMRPLMVEAVKKLTVHKTDGLMTCLGPTRTTSHFLKFTLDLLTAYKDAALFGVVWLNNFSHNNYNTPAVMDVPLFDFFHELPLTGALDDTLVVFFSDHGARFGKIRETYVGWLEERLPFVYIWMPAWFRARHPDAYRNLADNGDRLTSPFDLHLTLVDVLKESVGEAMSGNGTEGCASCSSLFDAVPVDRSCADAGISTHWCTCVSQVAMATTGEVVAGAVGKAVADINERLAALGNATANPCAVLKVNQIVSARVHKKDGRDGAKEFDDYVVVFDTLPGMALLDATVRYWVKEVPHRYQLMGMVSRINSIGSDGLCIDDKELRLYCSCL